MTANRAKRVAGDSYPTPDALALKIAQAHDARSDTLVPRAILEPSAGSGAFVRAARACWPGARVTAIEPDPDKRLTLHNAGTDTAHVGTLETFAHAPVYDLILGNPPYSLAQRHVALCLDLLAPGGSLVFLLRLAFLASQKRAAFLRANPPLRVDVLSGRPSFVWTWTCRACGYKFTTVPHGHVDTCANPACGEAYTQAMFARTTTDATDYAVFTWRQGYSGETRLGWL